MKTALKIVLYIISVLLLLSGLFFLASWFGFPKEKEVKFGVTFSTIMARQLGLEPREAFLSMADELGVKSVRLPIYWQNVEPERGNFAFGDYDYFFSVAEDRDIKIIPVIGRKLPRWPECHVPKWVITNDKLQITNEEFEDAVSNYIRKVINRYKDSPAVAGWQLENEHFHTFGAQCAAKKLSAEIIDRELALVRSLDPGHPVLLTDAGEGGWWGTSLQRSSYFGVTMYYQVWNPYWGVFWSPLGPGSYTLKKIFFELLYPNSRIIVAELQAEPFHNKLLPDYDLGIQKELMSAERFREVIRRARRAGFAENYLWGAEWWFWLKEKQDDPAIWDEAQKLFAPMQIYE